jgi:hypothetical protein
MKRILITLSLFACLFSCSNDDDSVTPEAQEPSFYALTIGNSWVYKSQQYNFNSQSYEDTEIVDSVSIVGTEEILGNTYFKFRTKTTGSVNGESQLSNPNGIKFEYFREIDGNLVNDSNDIVFTTIDYTEKLIVESSWGSIFEKLAEDLATVVVPAGTFECYNKQRYARTPEGEDLPSMDNIYYAEGIGLIYDSISFVSQENPIIIRRLDAYDIQ